MRAFVETTILADALLKKGDPGRRAKQALKGFDRTELPVYALKELKEGVLQNMAWFHNKLAAFGSFRKGLNALHSMSLTPRRYTTATAIEALREAADVVGKLTTQELVQSYGATAKLDAVLCDRFRLAIKLNIFQAWRRRRTIVTEVVSPLACYHEVAPYEERNPVAEERSLITLDPISCDANAECTIADSLKHQTKLLTLLKNVVDEQPAKRENERRSQALRKLIRTPKRDFPHASCRALGDAVFAFLAPPDSAILTANPRDMEPLARALGKTVISPS